MMIMEKNDYERIQHLLDTYMEGATTNAEEEKLRNFFASCGSDMPEEWLPYRALFGFVAEERAAANGRDTGGERTGASTGAQHPGTAPGTASRRWRTMRIVSAVSVAASTLLLFALATGRHQQGECYMVIDGKRYTGQKEVKAQALEALRMMGENSDKDPFAAMQMMR